MDVGPSGEDALLRSLKRLRRRLKHALITAVVVILALLFGGRLDAATLGALVQRLLGG